MFTGCRRLKRGWTPSAAVPLQMKERCDADLRRRHLDCRQATKWDHFETSAEAADAQPRQPRSLFATSESWKPSKAPSPNGKTGVSDA